MKRRHLILTLLCMVLVLTACGEQNLGMQEVMNKAIEASDELNSFSTEYSMEQEMTVEIEGERQQITMKGEGIADVVQEPLAMYQKMTMNMDMEELDLAEITPNNIQTEMYLVEDGIYIQNPLGGWMRFPEEMHEQLMSQSNLNQDPTKQLEQLKDFVDEFEMEETEESYMITASSSGEKLKDFITQTLEDMFADQPMLPLQSMEKAMDNMTINQVDYAIEIDKNTFYPQKTNMTMDIEMAIEGNTIKMNQDVHATYANYNDVDEIVVAGEIKENAQEMPGFPD